MSQGNPNVQAPSFFGSWIDGLKYLKAGLIGRKGFSIALLVVCLIDALAPDIPGMPIVEACLLYFIAYEVIQKAWEGKVGNRSDTGEKRTTAGVETKMFFNSFLYNICTILMGFFLVIPGVWFATRASLAMIFVSIENKGPLESLSMSVKLTDGRFIKSYLYMILGPIGLMLCLFVPVFVTTLATQLLLGEGPMPIIFKAIDLVSLPILNLLILSIYVPMLDLYRYYKELDESRANAG
ncbi:MAG: hypothetical protein H6677_19355 [Candidatus Obscuribacterales bacterium]|nr:hypothetical protein [Cyanobacteria bacterium HKST-UBA01]MCB9470438.1 hypothetical protein [Candidatus Obscuribacterales bacterium]